MDITTRVENEIHVVYIVGELDTNTSPDAEKHLSKLMDQGIKKIVINMIAIYTMTCSSSKDLK